MIHAGLKLRQSPYSLIAKGTAMSARPQPPPMFEDVWRLLQETGRFMKEGSRKTDREVQETERGTKDASHRITDANRHLEWFVEEMVRPAAVRLFQGRGQDVHQVIKNLAAYDDSGQFRCEVDLLVIHNQTGIVVKCKSHLSVNDVDEQVNRINIFKNCFPQYAGFVLWGAVAAVVVPDDVARYAHDKGLYVLAQKTETVRIRNSD